MMSVSTVHAEDKSAEAKKYGADPATYQKTVEKAIQFLVSQQAEDGSVSPDVGIGPTALMAWGMLRCNRSPDDPAVAKALAYLEKFEQEGGGIHKQGTFIANYETCVAIACFQEANRKGKYDKILKKADDYLRGVQWTEKFDKKKGELGYGGTGYGSKSRPDLSNTAYFVDALVANGAKSDDEAIQKALAFVSQCQNLESEYNTTPLASKINDGGFYYTPFTGGRGGDSSGSAEGGMSSYGSMSYSGLKSMIYAGLTKDDPRVKAATDWIKKNYDVKSNPGMGDAGLFYYYNTFAKAFDAWGLHEIEDAQSVKHDWRKDLTEELAKRQNENGSWVNSNTKWMEGDPNLATSFALLALSYCKPVAQDAGSSK